jgi:hypothetical protein
MPRVALEDENIRELEFRLISKKRDETSKKYDVSRTIYIWTISVYGLSIFVFLTLNSFIPLSKSISIRCIAFTSMSFICMYLVHTYHTEKFEEACIEYNSIKYVKNNG